VRALIQRVTRAEARVDDAVVGSIRGGLAILLGVRRGDEQADAERLAAKTARLRVFPDEAGRFDRSLLDVEGGALVVSQFTLYGDTRKGLRPSFTDAADPDVAIRLYEAYAGALGELGVAPVATGRFGASMQVSLTNDGPVTLLLES
jgi:D-tyrosyl-tRNA(Tyr) deacylase